MTSATDLVALAWVRFQPRTQALADDLGGLALFVDAGPRNTRTPRSALGQLTAALRTWRLLDRHAPVGVVALSAPVLAPLVAWAWCALRRRRLVIDCQPEEDVEADALAVHGPVRRFLLRRARAVLTHTPADLVLADRCRSHGVLLVDDLPQPAPAPPDRRPGMGGPDVAVAASLRPDEPFPVLLEAARLLPEVTFALTGDPELMPADVVAWLPPNVTLVGSPPRTQLLELFASAHVIVVLGGPANLSQPRAALEAVGLGRPLVLLDRPGARATFGQAALITPALPASLARAIRYGLEDHEGAAERARVLAGQLRERRARAIGRLRDLLQGTGPPRPPQVLILSRHVLGRHWVVRRNVCELLERGFDVDLVCLGRQPGEEEVRPGTGRLRVFALPVPEIGRGLLAAFAEQAVFVAIAVVLTAALAVRRGYAAVQVDNLPDALVVAALLPRVRGARLVLNLLDLAPELAAADRSGRLGRLLVVAARSVEGAARRCADEVIVSSEASRERVLARRADPVKVTVIVHSTPVTERPPRVPARPGALTELELGEGYLVACGPLEARHGTDLVVAAMATLREGRPRLRLRIAGVGRQVPALVEQVCALGLPRQVRFSGQLNWGRLLAEVRGARLGLLALVGDEYSDLLLPAELLLYARLEVPAVCPRLRAIASFFPPDSVAYFEPGDGADLARQAERLLRDPGRALAQARRAREVVASHDWERVGDLYVVQALGLTRRAIWPARPSTRPGLGHAGDVDAAIRNGRR